MDASIKRNLAKTIFMDVFLRLEKRTGIHILPLAGKIEMEDFLISRIQIWDLRLIRGLLILTRTR